jgi:hypothetical protein
VAPTPYPVLVYTVDRTSLKLSSPGLVLGHEVVGGEGGRGINDPANRSNSQNDDSETSGPWDELHCLETFSLRFRSHVKTDNETTGRLPSSADVTLCSQVELLPLFRMNLLPSSSGHNLSTAEKESLKSVYPPLQPKHGLPLLWFPTPTVEALPSVYSPLFIGWLRYHNVLKKLHGLSPRANYADRTTAACRRS